MNGHEISMQELLEIAHEAMLSRGLEPDFSPAVLTEVAGITKSAVEEHETLPDLTHLPWCSIDNDDSMDLDQITVITDQNASGCKILVAVADVDALVSIGDAIDQHAQKNTTSVYTAVQIFPMLPEKLSTNLTSLAEGQERLALIMEMQVDQTGKLKSSTIYRARVRNQAKLAYSSVAAWLDGQGPLPEAARKVKGMDEQLKIQDQYAQKLRTLRHELGALELETIEPRAVMKDDKIVGLKAETKNRAHELIEDFMVAANGVTARFLAAAGYPGLRRVVREPKRWDTIVQVAAEYGDTLPAQPDGKALAEFLLQRKTADPVRFPDLSLTIIKLLGRGEYELELPNATPVGHFGLAVSDYAHSTAPNRRFPDLIAHRLLKAALKKKPSPYDNETLKSLAEHCTQQEDAAEKAERQVRKSAAASLLSSRIGQHFDCIVTGASEKGVWGRVIDPPVEGKIVHGERGLNVGDRIRVKLISVDIQRGYIDFVRAGR